MRNCKNDPQVKAEPNSQKLQFKAEAKQRDSWDEYAHKEEAAKKRFFRFLHSIEESNEQNIRHSQRKMQRIEEAKVRRSLSKDELIPGDHINEMVREEWKKQS